jgi:hypothetical protein
MNPGSAEEVVSLIGVSSSSAVSKTPDKDFDLSLEPVNSIVLVNEAD